MPRRLLMTLILLACLTTALGCGTSRTKLDVVVENRSDATVTLWLYKDGPSVEPHLMSPGTLIAVKAPTSEDEQPSGPPAIWLKAGDTVQVGPVEGRFDDRNVPTLAVFTGTPSLSDLAATPKRSGSVARVPLGAGRNMVVVDAAFPVRAVRRDRFVATSE